MTALHGNNEIDINTYEIERKIDDILHENLPHFVPVNHDDIAIFLVKIIKEHNEREKEINKKLKKNI